MLTLKKHPITFCFINQIKVGFLNDRPEVRACIIEFNVQKYSDNLFTYLAVPFPEVLEKTIPKRRADFLAGRYAASYLLKSAGCYDAIPISSDRAPVWPKDWKGSISHTEKWALAVIAPSGSHLNIGVDIETLRPGIMQEISTTFTSVSERWLLSSCDIDYEIALLITFSAKESLFKALYSQVQYIFGFDAAKICDLNTLDCHFTLELTSQLAPSLHAGYQVKGRYSIGEYGVITLIAT